MCQGGRASDDRKGLLKQPAGLSTESYSGHKLLCVLDSIALTRSISSLLVGCAGKTKTGVPGIQGVPRPSVMRWSHFTNLIGGKTVLQHTA